MYSRTRAPGVEIQESPVLKPVGGGVVGGVVFVGGTPSWQVVVVRRKNKELLTALLLNPALFSPSIYNPRTVLGHRLKSMFRCRTIFAKQSRTVYARDHWDFFRRIQPTELFPCFCYA